MLSGGIWKNRRIALCVVIFIVGLAAACEMDTRVNISGGSAPEFSLHGSGKLGFLKITGPKFNDAPGEEAFVYWQIDPTAGYLNGISLWRLGTIRYGQVPQGYKQTFPRQGLPPALSEGVTYDAMFDTTGANGQRIQFTIRNGKAIELTEKPGAGNISVP